MARRFCQTVLTLALGYFLAVGAYALFAYGGPHGAPRPDAVTVAGDFHAWVLSIFRPRPAPPRAPGDVPPPREPEPPPAPPPPPPPPPEPTDPRSVAIARVERDILPRAEQDVRALSERGIADLADAKSKARATLVEARDLLGPLLDERRDDPEVQRLYKRVMELLIAVDKR